MDRRKKPTWVMWHDNFITSADYWHLQNFWKNLEESAEFDFRSNSVETHVLILTVASPYNWTLYRMVLKGTEWFLDFKNRHKSRVQAHKGVQKACGNGKKHLSFRPKFSKRDATVKNEKKPREIMTDQNLGSKTRRSCPKNQYPFP